RPKLAPYFPQAIRNIAEDLGIGEDQVSLKATTTEGMNDEGRGLCISAQAVANLV
ncbi:MAG: 2-C-methyl-D-erythritol 2,4-cyclodiphosphate synthase, partial [Clostridia bacterium]|nr:2-C-methyl-D-erythritol 2,4-cyclodiphosphate synthase [Clostridia bacterium]